MICENTREALACMSAAYFGYPAKKLVTIGITGTKGKTTTSYMIRNTLELAGYKTGLIGTIEAIIGENHIPYNNTTPESYFVQKYFRDTVFLRICRRIISVVMNTRISKIIFTVRACYLSSVRLALPMWMMNIWKRCFPVIPVSWKPMV